MERPGRALRRPVASVLPQAQHVLLLFRPWGPPSCLPCYVLLLSGQFVHCPSSLPAAENWRAMLSPGSAP